MYFKGIEMTGFKSFADRTRLALEPGVTAIVGPNGCGKSNILDAMRWSLGEQSAKALRGAHMQDVIFNGSEHRPPTGMAEVTLTFDNADGRLPVDFAEVQVARRVYRSGESEYLMNKAPCRLRDIQELFMDTGIGTSAYSLIGQGKIDLVLSSKPEDRRFLFEEAAGIIKYKTRKRIAMRKLDSAEQNLLRLGDIIAEVQRQMRSLKRQVNAAIRHRELTEALRNLEIRNAWLQHNELTGQIADLKERFGAAEDRYEKASAEVSRLEAQLEELNVKRIEMERVLMARRDGEHQLDSEMEQLENQVALVRKEIEFTQQQRETALQESEAFRERAAEIQRNQGQISEQATAFEREVLAVKDALSAKQQEYTELTERVAEADTHLEEMRQRALETINSRNRNQTELETLAVSLNNVDGQLQALYARQQEMESRHAAFTAQLEQAQQQEREHQAALTELADARQAAQAKHAELGERMQALNDEWQQLRERKSSEDARLNSLRELRDSYEGFAAGVRAVMQAKDGHIPDGDSIIGPVGDLINTEKSFERAIEAALGGNINNVVVEHADAAKSAIAFLKQHRAGRVTFLPLDTIRSSSRDDSGALAGQPGIIGKAIDHVQCEARILPAIEYLLYNTVIVQSIDDAIRIARAESRYPRLVTLDGEVVTSAGAVTGGRTKHESRGLIGRSAEIGELEQKVEQAAARIRTLGDEAQTVAQAIQEAAESIRQLEEQEGRQRAAVNESGVAVARTTTDLENLNASAREIAEQRDALVTQREGLEEKRRAAQDRATNMESDDEAVQRQVSEAQEAASKARHAQSECGEALSELRIQMASLTQSMEENERNRLREQRERDQALQEAERRVESAEQLKQREAELEAQVASRLERAKALSETREQAHAKVLDAQREQQALIEQMDTLNGRLKELRETSQTAQKEVHSLEIDLTQKEDRVESFEEQILREYNLALGALSEEEVGADEYDEEERTALIEDYRKKLQRLGTVNLMAIEEYEALEERNKFLVAQEEDLQQARQTLLDVVERIDTTIRAMFMETFREVSENFKNYFRRLFNGGQARIYLLDEDDPLESGIEIEARPPGKKPQGISLLSGGEQALTAIALLFSIFAAKPSPFCVLDEVDAPLDDANIGRFIGLLDEFVGKSQFIIITHNKQTMRRADALFGVTQQERGVSELVSVRFEEMEEAEATV